MNYNLKRVFHNLAFIASAILLAWIFLYPENLLPRVVLPVTHIRIFGIHNYLSSIIVVISLLLLVIAKRISLKRSFVTLPAFLIISWCLSSSFWAKDYNLVLQQCYYLAILGGGTFILFRNLGKIDSYASKLYIILISLMIIVSIIGILEAIKGSNIIYREVYEKYNPFFFSKAPLLQGNITGALKGKITSTIGHPAFLSLMIVIIMPFALHFVLEEKGAKKILGMIALISFTVALVFTLSRIGWIVCIVTTVIYLFKRGRKTILLILTLLAFITLILISFQPVRKSVYNRADLMFRSSESPIEIRKYRYIAVFNAFSPNPLYGIGFGQFYFRFSEFAPSGTIFDNTIRSSDNQISELLADLGVAGLLLFTWLILLVMYHLYRSYKKGSLMARAALVSIIAALIHSFFTPFLFWPTILVTLVAISGLALSSYKPEREPVSLINNLREIYYSLVSVVNYREMLFNMILKHLRIRYKGSILGFLWVILHPISYSLIFFVIFSIVVRIKVENYPLFLLSGLLPWIFFQGSISMNASSLVDNPNLIKKVYFPKEILPISYILSNITNLLVGIVILLLINRFAGVNLTYSILFLPIVLLFHILIISGISLAISALNVFYRDVSHLTEIGLTLLFYLTPIFYPETMVPEKFRSIYMLNPLACFASLYRYCLLGYEIDSSVTVIIAIASSIIIFAIGYKIFKMLDQQLAKEV
ncbi:MAG: ABC transporter permease [Candidatus Coatesbacteria bacterium]|nr:ABC transporter permease [Candidatus Coatesbacteria bacterium]